MPYKDKEKQKAFQNQWMKQRREQWIADRGPCRKCGGTNGLTVVSRYDDLNKQGVWSWSDEGRKAILRKCMVLCRTCALERHAEKMRKKFAGTGKTSNPSALTAEMVWMIRGRLLGREKIRAIAREFRVSHHIVLDIQKGTAWAWLKGGRRKVFGIQKTT